MEGLHTTSGQPEKDGDDTTGAEHLQERFYEAAVRPFSALVIYLVT